MDLSFLTGNTQPAVGAYQWANSNNANNGMNFSSPSLNYQPTTSPLNFATTGSPTVGTGTDTTGSGLQNQLGLNMPTFQLGLGALNSLGNLYGAFQSNKLAKDQLSFAKSVTNTNLNNQIKSYNTALEDRARSRAAAENKGSDYANDYVERNKLTR